MDAHQHVNGRLSFILDCPIKKYVSTMGVESSCDAAMSCVHHGFRISIDVAFVAFKLQRQAHSFSVAFRIWSSILRS